MVHFRRKSQIQNYLITRSARTSTFGGIVRPICFAAFRLMIGSNFIVLFRLTSVIRCLIKTLTILIIRCVVGAIAVSKKEEEQIEMLRKELGIATKSALIRTALKALEKKSQEEKLRREIRDSVSRCGAADREENKELFMAGVFRANRGE